jgi:hypothetical protein
MSTMPFVGVLKLLIVFEITGELVAFLRTMNLTVAPVRS